MDNETKELLDEMKKTPLSLNEASELIKWKDNRWWEVERKVVGGMIYPDTYKFAMSGEWQTYYMGKPVSGLKEAVEMNLSPIELAKMEMARDYGNMLDQSIVDMGGFEAMVEAYAAGVPIEDILA